MDHQDLCYHRVQIFFVFYLLTMWREHAVGFNGNFSCIENAGCAMPPGTHSSFSLSTGKAREGDTVL